jgi:hypothetical protein
MRALRRPFAWSAPLDSVEVLEIRQADATQTRLLLVGLGVAAVVTGLVLFYEALKKGFRAGEVLRPLEDYFDGPFEPHVWGSM